MKKKYCIANWKMNKSLVESDDFIKKILKKSLTLHKTQIILCPPFTWLFYISKILNGSEIQLGAQNVYCKKNGAFTGEISTNMLRDCGCVWVIIGHSERRHLFFEEEDLIRRKIKSALMNDLSPILCIGETSNERDKNLTYSVLKKQLTTALIEVDNDSIKKILIAYEPVWAIGTGKTATPKIILQTISIIKKILKLLKFNVNNVRIIYGGSVSSNNAKSILKIPDIDGFLIGGASLDTDEFYNIYKQFNI